MHLRDVPVQAALCTGRRLTVKFMTKPLGVAIVGIGWVGMEHLKAFLNNPHVAVVALGTRDEARARERLQHAGLQAPGARFTRRALPLATQAKAAG